MKLFLSMALILSSLNTTEAFAQRRPNSGPQGPRVGQSPAPRNPSGPRAGTQPRPERGPHVGNSPRNPRPAPPQVGNPPRNPRPAPPQVGNPPRNPRPTPPQVGNPPRNPRPAPPRVGNPPRPRRGDYGTPRYHSPPRYTPVRYNRYVHTPYNGRVIHTQRFYRTYDWYQYVLRSLPTAVYVHWIFYPAPYANGYRTIDAYPYFVFNNYAYRYSSNDYCNYQLVDTYNHHVVSEYWNQRCNAGYDQCSFQRDRMNVQANDFRYFCAESYRDYGFDYEAPTWEECRDDNYDGYCD